MTVPKTNKEPMALLHATSIQNASKILRYGKLSTGIDLYKNNIQSTGFTSGGWYPDDNNCTDQYPGVYFSVLFPTKSGEKIFYFDSSEIILVFCTALLNRKDYHWNPQDQNGHISSETLDHNEFPLAIKNDKDFIKQIVPDQMNELVVHHSVPLTFLREIWVQTKDAQATVEQYLSSSNKECPVVVKTIFSLKSYICVDKIERMNANMCFCFDKYKRNRKDEGFTENIEFYRKLAVQCGLSEKFAATYGKNDVAKLNKALVSIVNKNFLNVMNE